MAWSDLNPHKRIQAAHVDFMNDKQFALLSGVTMVGKVIIDPNFPTAGTDGRDVTYGEAFLMGHNRAQIRYLVAHENLHKALRHCTEYRDLAKKYGALLNMAMDYVINLLIEEMDAGRGFVERPTMVPPLVDAKYKGMSCVEVLRDLLKDAKQSGGGQGEGNGGFDVHDFDGAEEMTEAEAKEVKQQIEDAVRQGKLLVDKMAGNGEGGADVSALTRERHTNWREPLREFVTAVCAGDENSRFVPPNKRMMASGFLMPSHFSESTGELLIACDTSGSMTHIYPVVFGEIARICQHARPESVRLVWWDTAVCGEQTFKPSEYDQIATLLQPKGGGGTTPECVAAYVKEKGLKPKACVWLSDGDFYTTEVALDCPSLWGIVDNERFMPKFGKVLHISSE